MTPPLAPGTGEQQSRQDCSAGDNAALWLANGERADLVAEQVSRSGALVERDFASWLVAAAWYKTYVARIGDHDEGSVRVSDRDRNRAGAELRAHCVEGRISFEELERRLERTMSARVVDELAEVMHDLPASRLPVEPAQRSAQNGKVGPPGVRPFTRWVVVPAGMRRTRTVALDTLAPSLNRLSYELKHQSPSGLEFERTAKERIVISFEEHDANATMMIVHGRASRKIRKTFAKLDFS